MAEFQFVLQPGGPPLKFTDLGFAVWLQENFDDLCTEYKKHGRFLTLAELEQIARQESEKDMFRPRRLGMSEL